MSYLDGLVDASFKRQDDRSVAFYPYGVFGRGHVLPSEELERTIRRELKVSYVLAFAGMVALFFLAQRFFENIQFFAPFIVLPPFFIWFHLAISRKVRSLPVAPASLTLRDTADSQAKALSWPWLILLVLCSLPLLIAGVFILVASPHEWVIAVLAILFAGACLLSFGNVARHKLAIRRGPASNST